MLSSEQVQRYQGEGYLVLEAVIPDSEITALRAAARDIVDDFDIEQHRTVFTTTDRDAGRDDYFFRSAEAVHCFLEEGALNADGELTRPKETAINKFGHAMHDLVPEFTSFCRLPLFGEILRDIGYRSPQLWQTMYIFKQARIGGEVRWHQDASYLITEPPSVTGVWVALEDATRENGCLWMSPGAHRSPLRDIYEVDWKSREGTLRELDPTPWPRNSQAVALEVAAGSLVIFNDHMPHYSSQNYSNCSRQAFSMHIADASALWLEKNWLQRRKLGAFEL